MNAQISHELSSSNEMNGSHQDMVFSAARIAQIIAPDAESVQLPTEEQAHVIEQPLGGSVLVIAGAGSGKTETMANRVVWLVANGLASPEQILGLTFTRKAAGELSERVMSRLQQFAERLASPEIQPTLSASEQQRAEQLGGLMAEGLNLPEVSTYNAFASAVVQEFGAFAGVVAGATVIDKATAWGIARQIVSESDDPALIESEASISTIVKHVMQIDHAVADNLTDFDAVLRSVASIEQIETLPYKEGKIDGRYKAITDVLDNMRATRLAVALAKQFAEEKRRRGLIEFSDQLALAAETLRRSPHAVRVLRQRTPVVLLDEVQDTSVGQTVLLSMLFAGASVMAVGDPHQSIYGFRGASASNLQTFHRDFSQPDSDASSAVTLNLSTSWRNPTAVLGAANTVSAPLAETLEKQAADISVKPLTSRAQLFGTEDTADVPQLESLVFETVDEEFSALAAWMRDARNDHLARRGSLPTAAVVFRKRRHMAAVSAALWQEGVPNRIVGLGGLLTTPEITDLVSLLRCVWYADAGNELLRLLSGPRFRIGVADLAGLKDASYWFSKRDYAKQPLSEDDLSLTPPVSDPERQFTLLDTLDEIASMPNLDHSALRGISDVARQRLQEAGQMLQSLRRQVGADVPAFLRAATQQLRLDIELEAAEHTGYDGSATARANLDAFAELVEAFLATDEHGTLASVLAWLERATEDDEPAEHVPEPEPGTVQLITVHGAKGLEWDLVVVPRLVEHEFPASSQEGWGSLRPGQLPDELRGDAEARPKLQLEQAATQNDVRDAIGAYADALKTRHAEEERRLAYVAMTRAASRLLLTASFWGGQTAPRLPAPFLRELEAEGLIAQIPEQSAYEQDPNERNGRTVQWPLDPLGSRSGAVLAAATELRVLLGSADAAGQVQQPSVLHPVVELLLAERQGLSNQRVQTGLEKTPEVNARHSVAERLTASTFHEFIEHPDETERRRLRPMPVRPYRRTRTGNLFHEWVERRASTPLGTSLALSGLTPEEDENDSVDSLLQQSEPLEDLKLLIEQFEQSRWAGLQPIAVELEISLPFAGRTLVCKLDAVYRHEHAGETRYEIVDWKSGRPPKNEAERNSRFLQLDLYRHAYARWANMDAELIDVTLFYVAEAEELRGDAQRSLEDLERLYIQAEDSLAV